MQISAGSVSETYFSKFEFLIKVVLRCTYRALHAVMFYCPGGALEVRECWRAMTKCFHPVGEAYREKSNEEIVEMIRNTDLSETCRYASMLWKTFCIVKRE